MQKLSFSLLALNYNACEQGENDILRSDPMVLKPLIMQARTIQLNQPNAVQGRSCFQSHPQMANRAVCQNLFFSYLQPVE